jgi:hypothetical protein
MGKSRLPERVSDQPAAIRSPTDGEFSLFPLALTPFEKFVLWDEKSSQPMTSFIELQFQTPFDRELLSDALVMAVHRNPLLASTIAEHQGTLCWIYDPNYRPPLRSLENEPPVREGRLIPIDLSRECGSRYWYGATKEGWTLLVQLHHACCDGVGLRRVLIDVLTGYAQGTCSASAGTKEQLSPDEKPSLEQELPTEKNTSAYRWEKVKPELLSRRFDFSDSFSGPPKTPITLWQRIKNTHYFLFQPPMSLIGKTALASTPANARMTEAMADVAEDSQPMISTVVSRELSQRILACTRDRRVGVNELALTLLFVACARWNEAHGVTNKHGRLRLLMPYDLRSRTDLWMSAANRLSFSFLGRTVAQCADTAELYASVRRETMVIKDSHLPLEFLNGLAWLSRRPKLMKWALKRHRRMATAVLTYAGDISRGMKRHFPEQDGVRLIGDARLANILAVPPARENTNVSLGLCVNWGQLCFSAAWNRDAFSPQQCREFLDQYVTLWTDWLDLEWQVDELATLPE